MKRRLNRRPRRSAGDRQPLKALTYRDRATEESPSLSTGRQPQRGTPPAKDTPISFGRFWLQRFGLTVLLLAIVASTVNVLSLSSQAEMLSLNNAGNNSFLHSMPTYQAAADKLLSSSIWNHNKVTIDTNAISHQLTEQFPELASASVTVPLLSHRPIIYLQTNQPALILNTSNGAFVLDTAGKALLAGNGSGSPLLRNLPQVTDQSGLPIKLNHQALTAGNVSFIQTVVAQLATRHFTVSTMTLPAAASELDVHLNGQPYFIKFNLETNDARQQAGTFLATMAQLQKQHVTPAQYVDVRVDGRAYYQ